MTFPYGSSVIVHPGMDADIPAIDARVTTPGEPGRTGDGSHQAALAHAWYSLGYGEQWRDERINHDTALTYSAVWACVRVIAQSLAGVGWHAFERSEDGRSKLPIEDDVAWTLDLQANTETSAFDWRQVMLKDALTWGNGYAEIERTMGGRMMWLWRLSPDRVTPIRDEDGSLWYEVKNHGKPTSYINPFNMFHLKGLGPDGVVGWSVIEMARKSIQLGLHEERFGLQAFGKGTMPSGIIKIPRNMNDIQRKEYRRSFEEVYSGAANAHRVVVLSDGVEFEKMTIPNDDAQFLESRRFQVSEICRWYGVPPHKLADLERATFSNIEEQERAFVTDCLLAWARRLESEADIKLYSNVRRGKRYTRLNLDSLMRGNSTTQTATVAQKVNGAILTPNEGRAFFDLNPVPEGDVLLVQGAMIPLERAIEDPPAATPPAATPPDTGDGNDGSDDDSNDDGEGTRDGNAPQPSTASNDEIRRVFGGLLADAYSRLLRIDADKARRASAKGKLAEHAAEWYAPPSAVGRVYDLLCPTFDALALALGVPSSQAGLWATDAAARHTQRCYRDLKERGVDSVAKWESWPKELADTELGIILYHARGEATK